MALTQISTQGIKDGTITNADINASAAIAGTKIDPNFGTQTVTSSYLTLSAVNPNISFTDTNDNPDFKLEANSGQFKIIDTSGSGSDRLIVQNDGTIDVEGNLDANGGLDVTGAITGTGAITLGNGSGVNWGDTSARIIGESGGSGLLRFDTNGGEKMRIDSSGRVGIGTNDPLDNSILHVKSSAAADYRPLVVEGSATSGSGIAVLNSGTQRIFIGSGGGNNLSGSSTTDGLIRAENNTVFAVGNSEKMRIDSSGNVGIGTTSPDKPIHIFRASNDAEIRLQTNSGTERNSYISLRESSGDLDFYTVTASNMKFHTSNTERIRVTSDGNTVFRDKDSGHIGGGVYSRTKTVTLSGDNTTSFMRFSLTHGALAAIVYLTGSNNGSSVSRVYAVSCQFNDNDVQSLAYAGVYGGNGLVLNVSTSGSTHTFQAQVSGGTQEVTMTVHVGNANQDITYTEL